MADADLWPNVLTRLSRREHLETDEAAEAMRQIMAGEATSAQIGGFLLALRTKGETVDEIDGLARTMLEFAKDDNNGDWYSIVQHNARSALHRAHDRHGLYLRTWYGKKASRANAPKGSIQLHAANAALFAWMGALGR